MLHFQAEIPSVDATAVCLDDNALPRSLEIIVHS